MKKIISIISTIIVLTTIIIPFKVNAEISSNTTYSKMLERAEAIVNYDWIPSQRIDVWNENPYNGKMYFEKGEVVKGVPYTLFSYELGFDGLLSLEQYKTKAALNYSTTQYCNSVKDIRTGPAYGNCCGTFVSEVLGGNFMNGSNPRYDGVGTIESSQYGTCYRRVKANQLQPGDALSCTSGGHIVWVGDVNSDEIILYESTPPVSKITTLNLNEAVDENGYLIYHGGTYNIVTKNNELIRDDLAIASRLSTEIPMPLKAYTISTDKTIVYDAINGNAKTNKIYSTDECFIDAVFENGWCHVNFSLDSGGVENGYVRTDVFFNDISSMNTLATVTSATTYSRADKLFANGTFDFDKSVYLLNETDTQYQLAYSQSTGGYKVGWIDKDTFNKPIEKHQLNELCPFKAYTLVDDKTTAVAYQVKNGSVYGHIYGSDECNILEVYEDGWCKLQCEMYGGYETIFSKIEYFVNPDFVPYRSAIGNQVNTYKRANASDIWGYVYDEAVTVIGSEGNYSQIIYPLSAGGNKCAWVDKAALNSGDENIALSGIRLNTPPNKTEYSVGDAFSIEGLSLIAVYSDGSSIIIDNGFTVDGPDMSTAGAKTVNVSYEGFTIQFGIQINEAVVDNEARLVIEDKTVRIGEEFTVNVKIENNPGFSYMKLRAVFDASAFDFLGGTNGNVSTESFSSSGKAFVWDSDSDAVSDGTLLTMRFKAKDDAAIGDYSIGVSLVEAFDNNENDKEVSVKNSNISLVSFIYGDVTGDNEINGKDLIRLRKYLLNLDEVTGTSTVEITAGADVNGDGVVNGKDLIRLRKYLLNYDEETGTSSVVLGS